MTDELPETFDTIITDGDAITTQLPISEVLDEMKVRFDATADSLPVSEDLKGPDPLPAQDVQSPIFLIKFSDGEYAYNFKKIKTIDRQGNIILINKDAKSFENEETAIKIYETLLEIWARFA